jgi:hypothetical protein
MAWSVSKYGFSMIAGYSGWIAADLSAGPSIPVVLAATIGFGIMVRRLRQHAESPRSFRLWLMLLSVAVITALALGASSNKTVRYQVSWLPFFAALATAAWYPLQRTRWFRLGPVGMAVVAILLSLHNSFAILPVRPIRFGDWRILDSQFPLLIPIFDDNVPADPTDYHVSEAEALIAADAVARFPLGYVVRASVIENGVLLSHYYFNYFSAARGHGIEFGCDWLPDHQAPDYIVHVRGFDAFPLGRHLGSYYPSFEKDVAMNRIPYDELFHLNGPAHSSMLVYVRRSPGTPQFGPAIRPEINRSGISAGLPPTSTPFAYSLDEVVGVPIPLNLKNPLTISHSSLITGSGYAIDQESKNLAGGVDVVIDGLPFASRYQMDRLDVANYFKNPVYGQAGFAFSLPASLFGRGTHRLALRVIASDKKSYLESPSVPLEIL